MNPEALRHPSILRIERVAKALGDMVGEVVFIGGSEASQFAENELKH